MTPEKLLGIFDEPTTYRDEFRFHVVHRNVKENREEKKIVKKAIKKIPLFAVSHDTFQKFDYSNRLPFDALWGTEKSFTKNSQISRSNENSRKEIIRKKPSDFATLALNLDEVENPEMRKRILDYTYKSMASLSNEEVWRNSRKNNNELTNENCPNSVNSVGLKLKLIPDLPAGFKGAAKKWDSLQERSLIDEKNLNRTIESKNISSPYERKDDFDKLIYSEKKLSLPYQKLPLSYTGHRTPLALGVSLEKNKRSTFYPDLTPAQVLASIQCKED